MGVEVVLEESVRPRLRTESAVAVLARTHPNEQESVVMMPELGRVATDVEG